MAEGVVVEPGGLKPPSTAKEFIAAAIAGVVILGAANLAATGLKGLLQDDVRSSVVGLFFAGVAPVYGFANRALNGFKPVRLEMPELLPWYVSGLFAGGALFAWIQFVGFACGAGISLAVSARGLQIDITTTSTIIGMVMLPLLAPPAFLAGVVLNRTTRSLVVLSVLFAAILCAFFSFFMTWSLNQSAFQTLVVDQIAKDPTSSWGLFAASIVAFVFGMAGVGWSAFRRERSIGRIANAARRLKKDERDHILADINATLERAG